MHCMIAASREMPDEPYFARCQVVYLAPPTQSRVVIGSYGQHHGWIDVIMVCQPEAPFYNLAYVADTMCPVKAIVTHNDMFL